MDTPCEFRGCSKPAGILLGYWVFEDNRCRPFRLEGNHISCEGHAPEVAVEAYGKSLAPDSFESLVVIDTAKISPNKVMVYRLGEDRYMSVPKHTVQERVYEKLNESLKLAA